MIVVSDTSPITNLAAIDHLNLLRQLYRTVVIPTAVFEELTMAGDDIPGCQEVQAASWITVKSVENSQLVATLQEQLGPGESEAIALALELKSDWLLMDEALGRAIAATRQIRITGILGVLIESKHRGLIADVKPLLDQLIEQADFWVDQRLYTRVLETVEEV
ncbi:MAG: DUF3368 domain-containing protein [Cyanobacteria bacterium J06626_23]